MTKVNEQLVSIKHAGGSRRVYIWWGMVLGLLTVLGLLYCLVVVPVLDVGQEAGTLGEPVFTAPNRAGEDESAALAKNAVARLGGPEKAMSKIKLYLRMPEWVAPRKNRSLLMLGECGGPAVDTLIDFLGNGPASPTREAAWALGEIGPAAQKAIPLLVQLASRCSDNDISCCVVPLQKIDRQGGVVVPLLVDLLGKGDQETSLGAILLLGFYGSAAKSAVPRLIKALDDPATARSAARALVGIGPEAREAVSALIKALDSKDRSVKRDAIWALGRIGPEAGAAAPALLVIVLKEGLRGDQEARSRAAAALGRIGRSVVPDMVAALEGCLEGDHPLGWVLSMIGPDAVPEMLKIKDEYLGLANVLESLGRIGPQAGAAVPWLIGKFQRADAPRARPDIARALGRIGPAAFDAAPVLIGALADPSPEVRREATTALGRIGLAAKAALPELDAMSGDKDAVVRLAATTAAWKLRDEKDKAIDALVDGLALGQTRAYAIGELGALGLRAKAAGPALKVFLPDAAVAYWRVTGDARTALDALVPALADDDPAPASIAKRREAVFRLAAMGAAAKPALASVVRAKIESPDAGIKSWVRWRICSIEDPPSLVPEDQ
jgi:HEAT repeat protein